MRVTQLEIGRNLLTDLEKLNRSFTDINRQLSSGKKLNKLSDSPLGSADLVDITEQAQRLTAYRFNIIESKYRLQSAESVLNRANNAFVAIQTLGTQAATETLGNASRLAIVNEIEKLREELISIGNTQVDGKYIFAGTEVDTKPFELVENPPGSGFTRTDYLGNTTVNTVPVADGVELVASVHGQQALGAVFNEVDKLINAIRGAINGTGSVEDISISLSKFGVALDELGQARGQLGVSLSMAERMSEIVDSRNIVLTEQRSSIEDANIIEVGVRINELQKAMSAALSSGSVILQQNSLFDIIG